MKRSATVFTIPATLMLAVFLATTLHTWQNNRDTSPSAGVVQKALSIQIPFIENDGQVDRRVAFYANTFGGCVFVTKTGEIVYQSYAPYALEGDTHTSRGMALKEWFVGGKFQEVKGEGVSAIKAHSFRGNDPSGWKANVSTYETVCLGEVFPGIGLKLKAYGNNVEKLFFVKPGINPEVIRLGLDGADGLAVNITGELEVKTGLGPMTFTKPVAYQEIDGKRVEVDVEYCIWNEGRGDGDPAGRLGEAERTQREWMPTETGAAWASRYFGGYCPPSRTEIVHRKPMYGFKVAVYDKTKELVIDPLLASTFLGGADRDYIRSIAVDSKGDVYVAGYTRSSDFPTTTGVYDASFGGSNDVFISKFDKSLTAMLASTFLGGSGAEYVDGWNSSGSIAIDRAGNVYVAGQTYSANFPTAGDVYDASYNGSGDAFVSKFSGDLSSLLMSTYLGGKGDDYGRSLTMDAAGNVFLIGKTESSDFPVTPGSFSASFHGSSDIFITKMSGALKDLLASTYLGGSNSDFGYAIAITPGGNVYVAGRTKSSDFPTTSGAYDPSLDYNNFAAFLSKLNGGLTNLLSSTYLEGSGDDGCNSLAVGADGSVYVSGKTESPNFPTTPGAYDTSYNNKGDVFVSKMNGDLSALSASTFLGGTEDDTGNALAMDTGGNIYVAGKTESSNFPVTTGAYNAVYGNKGDAFVTKLNANLTDVAASTYLGGSEDDAGRFLAIDAGGNVYLVGQTQSLDFPVTAGAYAVSYGGNDSFVSKFDKNLSGSASLAVTEPAINVSASSATLFGKVNAGGMSVLSWFEYGTASGSYGGKSFSQTIRGLEETTVSFFVSELSSGTTYYFRIAAQDNAGVVYGNELSFTTSADTALPVGSITVNGNALYTNSPAVTLALSATDDAAVAGYYISTSSTPPAATTAGWTSTGFTDTFTLNVPYVLNGGDGAKTVYAWFKDKAGNVSKVAGDSITLDTIAPSVEITSPTSGGSYTATSGIISLKGKASDGASGITRITWSGKGGGGTAEGAANWTVPGITMAANETAVITVTATDGAGNSGDDSIIVTYAVSSTGTAASTGTATPSHVAQPSIAMPVLQPPAATETASAAPVSAPAPKKTTSFPFMKSTVKGVARGFVLDDDKKPLKGVVVTITGNGVSFTTETNKKGYYEFKNLPEGEYTLVYEKEGYVPAEDKP